jgi:hypothetical protein
VFYNLYWSRGSSVSVVSGYGLDDRGSIPGRGRRIKKVTYFEKLGIDNMIIFKIILNKWDLRLDIGFIWLISTSRGLKALSSMELFIVCVNGSRL